MAASETTPAASNGIEQVAPVESKPVAARKLHGREFYESIGCPKYIVAPMVDRSEFAWRMLTRSYMPPEESKSVLAYTPMFHARLFREEAGYRNKMFQPIRAAVGHKGDDSQDLYLDGNPKIDRPLFVQFCANDPDDFLEAARHVAPYCDAVDLNLGCPQGIARKGHYGAFLQEDWDLIYKLINKLHNELPVPVTAKFRIQESKEKTLEYAKMILSAGASVITLHGRTREQKGHNTGLADWSYIRYLRDNLPPETVIFANGNNLNHDDLAQCLEATGADGVMSAEGNLSDPSIFAKPPPVGSEGREYWRGRDGKGGYRVDAVFRRYLDIVYKYTLDQTPPQRKPLYVLGDPESSEEQPSQPESVTATEAASAPQPEGETEEGPPKKKQKKDKKQNAAHRPRQGNSNNINAKFMQPHLFQLFRPFIATHTNVRDALARSYPGDMSTFEHTLSVLEAEVKKGMQEYEKNPEKFEHKPDPSLTGSKATIAEYGRPWWVCQPHIRPLPEEALENGSMQLSKKDKQKLAENGAKGDEMAEVDATGLAASSAGADSVDTPTTAAKDALLSG